MHRALRFEVVEATRLYFQGLSGPRLVKLACRGGAKTLVNQAFPIGPTDSGARGRRFKSSHSDQLARDKTAHRKVRRSFVTIARKLKSFTELYQWESSVNVPPVSRAAALQPQPVGLRWL